MSQVKDEKDDGAASPHAGPSRASRPATPPLPSSRSRSRSRSRTGSPRPPGANDSKPAATINHLFDDWDTTARPPSPPKRERSETPPYSFSLTHTPADVGTPGTDGEAGPSRKKKVHTPPPQPVLVPDLPLAWNEAGETFESLEKCVYERKDLGLSREQDEMMVCDCTYDPDDPYADPCGHDSDCINRAIFIECLAKECKAGKQCRNQRFARRQYAPVDVVQTEKKGFGLRTSQNIPAGSLIYEYIGEVVIEKTFRKRMTQYADEGIKHFYFMMLQKEEYIDATKKGGIGRFANHSCNPNCEVQKWVVGRRMRMGIFSKRDILKDEEITFNYNVDRYGHEAQICYCGEPNCVGFIGGKTQTDIGGMDDLFLDALGITAEVKAKGLKGNKKKAALQLGVDYMPDLKPITEDQEVTKVAAAMRQSMENPLMMGKLLERVKKTDEPALHRQLMRMHGFSLMTMVLTDMSSDHDIITSALEGMKQWKLTMRNKIEDSNIEEPVRALAEGEDQEQAALAKELLQYWSTLELSYKIPRKTKLASLDDEDAEHTRTIAEQDEMPRRYVHLDDLANRTAITLDLAPVRRAGPPVRHRPPPPRPPPPPSRQPSKTAINDRSKLDSIIAMAAQAQVVPLPPPETAADTRRGDVEASEPRKRRKTTHRDVGPEEEARKEKRLTKLVGEVVVRSMSKYKDQMEHETFKRYAKECTAILVDKEKRGSSYQSHRHPSLSDDKKVKIKAFTKEYAHKVLKKLKAKGKLIKPARRDAPSSSSTSTPSRPVLTPSATPGISASTPTGSHGTPNGTGDILDEMFGVDDDHMDDDADMDDDNGSSGTPFESSRRGSQATPRDFDLPSSNGTPRMPASLATPESSTPPAALVSSPPVHFQTKPVVHEHVSGPFLPARTGPILVDSFKGVRLPFAMPSDSGASSRPPTE